MPSGAAVGPALCGQQPLPLTAGDVDPATLTSKNCTCSLASAFAIETTAICVPSGEMATSAPTTASLKGTVGWAESASGATTVTVEVTMPPQADWTPYAPGKVPSACCCDSSCST